MTIVPILDNGHLRLIFEGEGGLVSGFTLDVYADGQPRRMGALQPISLAVYRDKVGARQEIAFAACAAEVAEGRVTLRQAHAGEGGHAALTATFALTDDPYQVAVDYRLETGESWGLLHWQGPSIYAGEGSFGTAKDEALFPGLEYLLNGEPSSDTRFAAEKHARRHTPHPYKVTVPLMAVSHKGRAVGLMWDPHQDWHNGWRHPRALFSSPNRLQEGMQNHWLALSAPGVDPRWLNEGELEAHTPVFSRLASLSARLVAQPEGGVTSIMAAWLETYGLPELPDPGHDYRQNVELCVRSFLDVAWDEENEGWHHTLSDPWGPRYEANLANLLWRYSRWPDGDAILGARARDQVRRGVTRARRKSQDVAPAPASPWPSAGGKGPSAIPHMDLALLYGHVADALDVAAVAAREAIAAQQADGSWPWKPDAVQEVASFKTAERLALMGKEGDSATGFTASRSRPVLQYALYTGDREAGSAARRAADWCNTQCRPEGAQAWELHLHVPDVLAVPHLINLNLGVYELTGEAGYVEAANRWAWTGLPFTYLWNAYFRPVMRYGTIPVFGVTFHDVQPWFGVIVHWNGLVYADALFRLARYRPSDGPANWGHLAEGITRHGMQEQMTHGPHLGMYPDAFSPIKADEEYTWWLNPQLIGLNTFPLAGLPALTETHVLREGSQVVYFTSGATLLQASRDVDGMLRLFLQDQAGEANFTLLSLSQPPVRIACENKLLPAVTDVDAAPEGWQWLEAHKVALVKVEHKQSVVTLNVR
jgi:hypothetical protein